MVHFYGIIEGPEALFLNGFSLLPCGDSSNRLSAFCTLLFREEKSLRTLPTRASYDHYLPSDPSKPYQLPGQKRELLAKYWPVRYAARKWGCSYRAARLYILRHPEIGVLVRVQHFSAPKPRWIIAARAGFAKVPAMRGNPDLLDPHWQREQALRRWNRLKAEKSEA